MHQVDITLTDFFLSAECFVFAALLFARKSRSRIAELAFSATFATLGLAALFGGIWHGFYSQFPSSAGTVIWTATLLALGLTAVGLWFVSSALAHTESWAFRFKAIAIFQFLGFVGLLFCTDAFVLGSLNLLPPLGMTIILFARYYLNTRRPRLVLGLVGLLLIVVAGAILAFEVALPPLSPIAVYHVAQIVSVGLVFLSIPGLDKKFG